MGEDADGVQGLVKLPFGDAGGATEGVEEGLGSFGGGGAVGFGPEAGPAVAVGEGAVAHAGGGEAVVVGVGEEGHGGAQARPDW